MSSRTSPARLRRGDEAVERRLERELLARERRSSIADVRPRGVEERAVGGEHLGPARHDLGDRTQARRRARAATSAISARSRAMRSIEHGRDELRLGREVAEERPLGHARPPCDLARPRRRSRPRRTRCAAASSSRRAVALRVGAPGRLGARAALTPSRPAPARRALDRHVRDVARAQEDHEHDVAEQHQPGGDDEREPVARHVGRRRPPSRSGGARDAAEQVPVCVAAIVARIASPSAPPICWAVLKRPDASPAVLVRRRSRPPISVAGTKAKPEPDREQHERRQQRAGVGRVHADPRHQREARRRRP